MRAAQMRQNDQHRDPLFSCTYARLRDLTTYPAHTYRNCRVGYAPDSVSLLQLDHGDGSAAALVGFGANALHQRMRREKFSQAAPQRARAVTGNHAHLRLPRPGPPPGRAASPPGRAFAGAPAAGLAARSVTMAMISASGTFMRSGPASTSADDPSRRRSTTGAANPRTRPPR